ncbi:mechanosensitive ion channel domain-containing protein [Natronoarchaeum mannanilyticum]|uniref:Mechanosensitive ion channel MscS domain-containing protein n=1 Tax=Natronoarchaeum mannanilyticum TaxID=926360 RepID=A0AAV3T7T8_9EURY
MAIQLQLSRATDTVVEELVDGAIAALPRLVIGLVFLSLAYVGIKVALALVRSALSRVYAGEQRLIADLFTAIVGVFLWFGVALTLLKVVGMGDIAASLGTAAGFVALGISFALSNMIADTVAGVYLLRDPDFEIGDRVTVESVTGTVVGIELRKCRIELDSGDTVVLANKDVEKKWTRLADADAAEVPGAPAE